MIKLSFDSLATSTHISMFRDVPMAKFASLQKFVNLAIKCPPEKKAHLDKWWDAVDFVDESVWSNQNLILTQDNAGNAKYLTLMYNKNDDDDLITFMVSDTQANFNVADDMWMWERSTSKMGGLMQKQETIVQYLPHTVSFDDAKVLMNIFDTVALTKFKQYVQALHDSEQINPNNFLN